MIDPKLSQEMPAGPTLHAEERVVWRGSSSAAKLTWTVVAGSAIFFILTTINLFAFFLCVRGVVVHREATARASDAASHLVLWVVIGLPLLALSLYCLYAPFQDIRRRRRVQYFVTNQRAIVFDKHSKRRPQETSYSFATTTHFECQQRTDGAGSIVFGRGVKTDGDGGTQIELLGFLGVPNVVEAETALREAQAEFLSNAFRTPRSDLPSSQEIRKSQELLAAFGKDGESVRVRLEKDEVVLWVDRPDWHACRLELSRLLVGCAVAVIGVSTGAWVCWSLLSHAKNKPSDDLVMGVVMSVFFAWGGVWMITSTFVARARLRKNLQVITGLRVLIVKPMRRSVTVQQFALQSIGALQMSESNEGFGDILFRSRLGHSEDFSDVGLRGLKDVRQVTLILEQAHREAMAAKV